MKPFKTNQDIDIKPKPHEAESPKFSENISSFFLCPVVIEITKFENRTSDGEIFLPIWRDDSPEYFVLYETVKLFSLIRNCHGNKPRLLPSNRKIQVADHQSADYL